MIPPRTKLGREDHKFCQIWPRFGALVMALSMNRAVIDADSDTTVLYSSRTTSLPMEMAVAHGVAHTIFDLF